MEFLGVPLLVLVKLLVCLLLLLLECLAVLLFVKLQSVLLVLRLLLPLGHGPLVELLLLAQLLQLFVLLAILVVVVGNGPPRDGGRAGKWACSGGRGVGS